jgi:hypothetical protein
VPPIASYRRVADVRNIPRLKKMPRRIDVHDETAPIRKKIS